jgi:hypothetical protein
VIFFYLWRAGLLGRADREKLGFFLGLTGGSLFLSRRWPPVASVQWLRAMIDPAYARSVAAWLLYRADLYDGRQG